MLGPLFSKPHARRRIQLLYAGTLVLLFIVLVAAILSFNDYQRLISERRTVGFARTQSDALLSSLKDAETGCRGYLLTQDTVYLAPYHNAQYEAREHLNDLDSVLVDSNDRSRVRELRDLSTRALLQNREMIRLDAQSVLGTTELNKDRLERNRGVMDRIRELHAELDEHLLAKRQVLDKQETSLGWTAPFMLLLYASLAMLATAVLFRWLFRALTKAEEAEREIQQKVAELDKEVLTRETAERALRRVLDSSISGIMAFRCLRNDMGEVADLEWTLVNNRGLELLGRKEEDLMGHRLLDVLPHSRASGLWGHFLNVVEKGEPVHAVLNYRGDGIHRVLELSAVRQMDGLVTTFTDITEQVRMEDLAQESERLALTGRIARTVAHEVRNPLTNVRLAMEELREGSLAPEEEALYWDIAVRNTARIGQLITEMLDSSRQRELVLVPVAVRSLLGGAVDQVKDRSELKRIRLEWDLADDLPAVLVDREKMKLALVNLCINAIEAMEPHVGVLTLAARIVGNELTLRITDNGKGIAQEEQDKLFESFYTGRPGGMGLGLTTARSILNSHGVHVEVESELGKGTTFALTFSKDRLSRERSA